MLPAWKPSPALRTPAVVTSEPSHTEQNPLTSVKFRFPADNLKRSPQIFRAVVVGYCNGGRIKSGVDSAMGANLQPGPEVLGSPQGDTWIRWCYCKVLMSLRL